MMRWRSCRGAMVGWVALLGVSLPAQEKSDLQGLRVVQVGPVGLPALRVDLVIVGEGYIAEDFKPKGKWEIDSARLVKNFFEKLPFKALRNLFNVHLVEVHSQERGADDSPGSNTRRTAFNATYGAHGIDRLLVCRDQRAVLRAARNAPQADMILVLVNDGRFGGSGGKEQGIPLSTCSTQPTAYEIAIHELGHSFANLADEYVDEPIADKYPLPREGDFREPNVTLAKFVDASNFDRLCETLKWGHFLEEPGSAQRYGKGYFEGAYYRKQGVYRPAIGCVMGTQSGTGGFCYVCNAEMTRVIHRTAGRGPAGGVFPAEVARLKGRLRIPYYFYSQGLFGRVVGDLDKLDGSGKLSEDEKQGENGLRKGVELSFEEECRRIEEARASGDVLTARERIDLLQLSFRSTPFAAKADDLKKTLTSDPGFKKEMEAERELLPLEWTGKALPTAGPDRQAWKRRLEEFLRKFKDTKAAERAKKLSGWGIPG
jgi:IgA peptidase M64